MNKIDRQSRIDDYILGRMPEYERNEFQKEMQENVDLGESVQLQQLLISEMKQREFIHDVIKEADIRSRKKNRIRKTILAGISVAAIFLAVFFVNKVITFRHMDSLYLEMYAYPDKDNFRSDDMDVEQKEFMQAIDYLETGNPDKALSALLLLYNNPMDYLYYEDVRWYLALTELSLHNKTEAKRYLSELISMDSENREYDQKAQELLSKLR